MTLQQRAEKIYQALLKPETSREFKDPTELIASEISRAVEEDRLNRLAMPKGWAIELQKAKTEAYEDAAKIVEAYGPNAGLSERNWATPNLLARLSAQISARAKEVQGQ